jgi:hypothetical protein
MSSARQSEVKAWEEEISPCDHTRNLVQPGPKQLEQSGEHDLLLFGDALLIHFQASHIAPNATSPRTCGYALHVPLWDAVGSSLVVLVATATLSITLRRPDIQSLSSLGPSSPTVQQVGFF